MFWLHLTQLFPIVYSYIMDASAQITVEEKTTIYNNLADLLMNGLKNGELFEEDVQNSSKFILEKMESITTKEELITFLKILSDRWDIYREEYLKYKKDDLMGKIQTELQQLSS